MPQTPIPSLQFHRTKQAVGLERERERERERDRRCAGCRPAGRVSRQPISLFAPSPSKPPYEDSLVFQKRHTNKQLFFELQFGTEAAPFRAAIRNQAAPIRAAIRHRRGSPPSSNPISTPFLCRSRKGIESVSCSVCEVQSEAQTKPI